MKIKSILLCILFICFGCKPVEAVNSKIVIHVCQGSEKYLRYGLPYDGKFNELVLEEESVTHDSKKLAWLLDQDKAKESGASVEEFIEKLSRTINKNNIENLQNTVSKIYEYHARFAYKENAIAIRSEIDGSELKDFLPTLFRFNNQLTFGLCLVASTPMLIDLNTLEFFALKKQTEVRRYSFRWSSDGQHLAYKTSYNDFLVYNLEDKKIIYTGKCKGSVEDIAWSPESSLLAVIDSVEIYGRKRFKDILLAVSGHPVPYKDLSIKVINLNTQKEEEVRVRESVQAGEASIEWLSM